ncbi:MAG: AEC family transporter [Bacteroidia bacterium]|nr:AEC family transporter [Bacteroidia bacterium]
MSSFFLAAKSILPLFLVILTGIGMVRIKAVHPGWVDVLNKYALWIGLPSLIFVALSRLDLRFGEYSNLIILNSIYLIICVLLAFPISMLFKTSLKTKRTLFLLLGFGNISYLGIPLISSALGNEALGPAILLSAVYPFWMFTLAIVLIELTGHEKVHILLIIKKLGTNPLLVSVFLGIIASWFKIPVQSALMKTLDLFGQSVTAVVLFSLGIFLGSQQIGNRKEWWPVFGLSIVIMIILPGLFYFLAKGSGMTNLQFRTSILDAAMPMGLTAYAMTEQYQLNALLTGRLVILSTLLAAIILPIWIVFTA